VHKLSDMIASLPRPFSRDPIPLAALSVRLPAGANWVVQDKVLYTSVGSGQTSLRVDLRGKTVTQVSAAVAAVAGYTSSVLNSLGPQAAYSLIEGQYSDPSGAGVQVPIHTSPTYQLLAPMALGLDNLNDDLQQAFQQTILTSAVGPWLDHWGRLFGAPRLASESDLNYSRRINGSALIAKTNGWSIIQMLKKIAQIDATITSEGGAAFTISTTLSDSAGTTYDTSAMAIFIRDWKALGVIATVNFQTAGSEIYTTANVTDSFTDSFIGGGPGGWASPEFAAKEEGG
jgi:hypothetical protein